MRINAYLARQLGISRREADRLIAAGQVKINDTVVVPGQQFNSADDLLTLDGDPIDTQPPDKVTIALYKPRSYVCTRSDPQGRRTVMSLLPAELQHLKPAGRLDYDSEGLILLSNDGQFIFEATHPKFEGQKEYRVSFKMPVQPSLLATFQQGIPLAEGIARADRVKQTGLTEVEVVIHQGWNRQLRRMAEACGYEVTRLVRTRVGKFRLGSLQPGRWREIKP